MPLLFKNFKKRVLMKIIFLVISIFLFSQVSHASTVLPTDDCFALSFWYNANFDNMRADYSIYNEKLFTIKNESGVDVVTWVAEYETEQNLIYTFKSSTNNSLSFWGGKTSKDKHLVNINYCSTSKFHLPYAWDGRIYYADSSIDLYIDGVHQNIIWPPQGVLPSFVSGTVEFNDKILQDTFFYNKNPLSQSEVSSLYNFGQPGTIKYQVNVLYWEVIKHFRSFF